MKKLLKKTLKLILPVVLGGFILFWVYRDFDFTKAGDVLLHGTNWWWMLFSLLFGVFAQVFRVICHLTNFLDNIFVSKFAAVDAGN